MDQTERRRNRRTQRWWKEQFVATHRAKLRSNILLREFMRTKNINAVILANRVSTERCRYTGDPTKNVSRQFIERLLTDNPKRMARTCSPDLAAAIETVLEAPRGLLFDVVEKSPDTGNNANGQAA